MTPYEQAERYLAKIPPAVSGSGGHNQTFSAACALVHGFALTEGDALRLMVPWNRMCQPPWSDKDLEHKIRDAAKHGGHSKPKGHLIRADKRKNPHRMPSAASPVKPPPPPEQVAPDYLDDEEREELPLPMADGARVLLRLAFEKGEGVRIVPAEFDNEGHERPNGQGPCLTREDWLDRLDLRGGSPNEFWSATKQTGAGIYITINPLKLGGSKDADVTSFRHCLLEFDDLSLVEQWTLYKRSNIPCTAVIHSGKKSIHAWVRVDAKDRREYDERVSILYKHFEAYGIDIKNKNPSRLSRMPNCTRMGQRQELLATGIGAASFSAWVAERAADDIGEVMTLKALAGFDPGRDDDSLLGNRWLCRGGSLLFVGQSGIGKSSLSLQMAITWALGRPAFGIAPRKPIKVLIIQAENDLGDTAEMLQGVLKGIGLTAFHDEFDSLEQNLIIVRDSTRTGERFCDAVRRLIDKHRPDLVLMDPLLSFIGDDISRQEVCGRFLRNWLNPIAQSTGVAWMMCHHTGKPPSEQSKGKYPTRESSDSYMGLGSSELTNWARATAVLRQTGNHFELSLAKRGKRALATELDGRPTELITLGHAKVGIHWEQLDPLVVATEVASRQLEKPRKKTKLEKIRECGLGRFLDGIPLQGHGEGLTKNRLAERLSVFVATKATTRVSISRSEAIKVLDCLIEEFVLDLGPDLKIYRNQPAESNLPTAQI